MKIGFFGLSHLGLNYLAANAFKGHKVIGYDRDNYLIKDLTSGKKLFKEPFLFENINRYKKNIKFTNNLKDLKINELVVHQDHGIGKYKGLITMNIESKTTELIKIEYPLL